MIDSPDSATASTVETQFGTYTDGNALQGIITEYAGGVDIQFSGTGSGSSGGFDAGQKYLAFHTLNQETTNGPRYVTFSEIDASFLNNNGSVTNVEIDVHVGNDSNGGELPDALNEGLQLRFSTDDGATWTSAGFLASTDLDDDDPSTWPTFVRWVDQSKNCLLYTSPSPRDVEESRMPSSA